MITLHAEWQFGHCHCEVISAPYGHCHSTVFSAPVVTVTVKCSVNLMVTVNLQCLVLLMVSVTLKYSVLLMVTATLQCSVLLMVTVTQKCSVFLMVTVILLLTRSSYSLISKWYSSHSLLPFQHSAVPKILQSMSTAIKSQLSLHHRCCFLSPKLSQNFRSHSIIFTGTSADLSTYT